MRQRRIISSSIRVMGRHRLRTFFMMLGTLIGVTALTVVTALGQGTQRQMMDRMDRMFSGSSIFVTASAASRSSPHGPRTTTLTLGDLDAIETTFPEAVVASDCGSRKRP